MAVFPSLSRKAALEQIDDFRNDFVYGIRTILFIMIPFSAMLIALGVPFIRLLYEVGKFNSSNTQAVAFALYFYSIGIFAQGCIQVLNRAFYAFQDTKKPVMVAVSGVAINLILSFILINYLQQGGLALAFSVAGICNMIFLFLLLKRKLGHIGLKEIGASALKTLMASAAMAAAAYGIAYGSETLFGITSKLTQLLQFFLAGMIGMIIFFLLTKWLKMPEIETVLRTLKRRFGRRNKKETA
jgi:putative peptidoglycan lipid II flippase